MNLTIQSLKITNFKGIRSLSVPLHGDSLSIYGDNATGKTTVMDAWLWLLFDKDSSNRSAFSVKPQDSDGNEVHNLDTSVEAELLIDGGVTTVSKTLTEKWTTKRGFSVAEFTGNETSYMIDGVPRKAGEWKEFVKSLVDEDAFKLLSNPLHFNVALSWQERRKVLFSMIDGIDDAALARGDDRYASVLQLLDKHTVEDARKAIDYQIKELEKKRAGIAPRIDEQTRSIPAEMEDTAHAAEDLAAHKAELEQLDARLSDARAIGERIAANHRQLANLKVKREQAIAQAVSDANRERDDGLKRLREARNQLASAEDASARIMDAIASKMARKAELDAERDTLRKEYGEVATERYGDSGGDDTCAACGQRLPESALSVAADKRRAAWEERKQTCLAHINTRGMALKTRIEELEKQINADQSASDSATERISGLTVSVDDLSVYESMPDAAPKVVTYEYDAAIAQLEALLADATGADTSAVTAERAELMRKIERAQAITAAGDQVLRARARIEELSEEEARIGIDLTALEGQRYLLEQLVMEKCGLLEERVNALFPTVRWKLFDRAINGGVSDCCVCLIGGVPFQDANNAAKINAGLEIIERLCVHIGARVPIFIDNREAVNRLEPTGSQTISLVVSDDPELRWERSSAANAA